VKSNVLSEDDSFNLGTRKTREIVQPQRELSTDEYLEEEKKLVKDEDEGYNDEGNTKENFASFVRVRLVCTHISIGPSWAKISHHEQVFDSR
jgi:hypothetical protein